MIEPKSGRLVLGTDNCIVPFMALEAIQQMQLGETQKLRNMGNGWSWLDIKNLKLEVHFYNISFLFKQDILQGMTFVFQDEAYPLTASWDTWNEKEERAQAIHFNNWLDEILSNKRHFDWGEAWAGYDQRGGASSIRIKYKAS